MSQKCATDQCRRTSRALCKCCNQDLCLQHIWKHKDLIISQFNTLKKQIHEVDCRLKFVDIPKSAANFREQMKQWRTDSYTIIDRFYEQKCQELNQYIKEKVDDQREYIDRLQKQIDEFIEKEYGNQYDIDLIKSNIININGKIDKIEQTSFPMTILPLPIDDNLIQIRK